MPLVAWKDFVALPASSLEAFGLVLLLAVVAERLTFANSVGGSKGTNSVGWIPALATVLLFGSAAPLILVLVAGSVGEFLMRKKPWVKAAFNLAQWTLSAAVAGALYDALGGVPAGQSGLGVGAGFSIQWIPFLAFGLVFMVMNQVLVSYAIAIASGARFADIWRKMAGTAGSNVLYDLLVSPVAIAIALLAVELGPLGLFIAFLPLLAIRNAYLTAFRLQQANRDLLNALVKAIETRDPYTSGHSVRVAQLAMLVARRMGLSQKLVDQTEQSALLHDVGKIDAVYTEILRKPGGLTDEERDVIESHVSKGVELLTTLSSVPDAVILDVQHHHERWDGRGYPDGLAGEDIPLGARIINVCDAVDAMLSDRPYRDALSVGTVRQELLRYQGVQFDPGVVSVLVSSDALERHLELTLSASARESSQAEINPKSEGQHAGGSVRRLGRTPASTSEHERGLSQA